MEIELLPAEYGDAIVIRTMAGGKPFTIVVDGGPRITAHNISKQYVELGHIDLMILTHFDEDHIMGIIKYVENHQGKRIPVSEFWCNCSQKIDLEGDTSISSMGYANANTLANYLRYQQRMDESFRWTDIITNSKEPWILKDLRIDVLSPTKDLLTQLQIEYEDYVKLHPWVDDEEKSTQIAKINNNPDISRSIDELARSDKPRIVNLWNRASIAILLTAEEKKVLMLGDADAEVIADSIEKLIGKGNVLDVDMIKLSHHGSKHNVSKRLLSLLRCNNYAISTCGGTLSFCHPDRKTLALILRNSNRDKKLPINFYFNYPLVEIQKRTGTLLTVDETGIEEENCNLVEKRLIVL